MPPPADDVRAGGPVEGLEERVDGIAAWINDLDTRVRAAEFSAGDEKTARELRRAIEALSKHDPKLEKRLTNRVDVLADRLATLASTVSTTAAALARKDGEIAALRKELDEDTRRVEALARDRDKDGSAAEIEKLRSAIRAVQAERPGRTSDARVDGLGTKIDYLTERVDTLGKTVATTAAGLVGREGEIATLRQRLEERSAEIERTASEVRRLQGDSGLTQRIDALQATVDATAAGLATRESDAGALKARIDEAYSRVGTAVTDLQSSIATLSSQVQALESLPGATEEVIAAQELDERFEAIQKRIDDLGTNVASALGGLEDRARDTTALAQRVDEASGRVDEVVTELRHALGQLPAPGTVDPEVEGRLIELAAAVAAASDGLAAVETSSSARAEDVATRTAAVEQLVAAAGGRLETVERDRDAAAETISRASAAWAEGQEWVRGRLDALASAQASAETSHETVGPLLDETRARLDTLDGAHAAAAAEIVRVSAALEGERAAVLNRVEALAASLAQTAEASSAGAEGIERALGELGARVQSIEEKGASAESEIARLSAGLDAERLSLRADLETLAASVAEAEPSSTGAEAIERALGELGARLLIVEERGTLSSSEIARVSAALDAERAALHAQLDTLAASVADPGLSRVGGEGSEEMLDDLVARLRAVEESRAATATEVARTAALWASELEAVEKRLTHASRAADGTAVASNPETDRLVAELAGRLDELERDRQAMVAELARVHTWEAERAALVARLDGMAASLAEVESGKGAQTPAAVGGDEVVQLRVAVDGMRMRLASNEQELATVVGTRDTATRLDEVTRRLEALERAPVVIAGGADGGPAAGDGRFRLELRALELRMEHAEAAARENREAVLVQLERLAARIEWRFQRLESEYEAGQPEAIGGGGQVVPIRPTDTQK